MEDYVKFLKRLPKNLRLKLIQAVSLITENKLENLDIKSLSGRFNLFRCRVGQIRIIFQKREDGNWIMDIGFRGGIYRKFD